MTGTKAIEWLMGVEPMPSQWIKVEGERHAAIIIIMLLSVWIGTMWVFFSNSDHKLVDLGVGRPLSVCIKTVPVL